MIRLTRMNAVALKVRDLQASMAWYREHFGFEYRHAAEGCVVLGVGAVELVLSPHANPDAPLADPRHMRCIHTLAFEIPDDEFDKLRAEFQDDPDLVLCDQPEFRSIITTDPDSYCVELYCNKPPARVGIPT